MGNTREETNYQRNQMKILELKNKISKISLEELSSKMDTEE